METDGLKMKGRGSMAGVEFCAAGFGVIAR